MPMAIPAIMVIAGATAVQVAVVSLIIMAGQMIYGNAQKRRAERQRKNDYNASLTDKSISAAIEDAPHRRVYGRDKVGSYFAGFLTGGDKDQYKYQICVHAMHEIDGYEEIFVNGKSLGTLDANGDVTGGDYFKTRTENHSAYIPNTVYTFVLPHIPIETTLVVATTSNNAEEGVIHLIPGEQYTYAPGTRTVTINGSVTSSSDFVYSYQYATGTPMVRVSKHLGTPTDGPDAMLRSEVPGQWPDSSVLRNHAYTVVRLDINHAEFQAGPMPVQVLIRGAKLYDYRTGITAWSQNNALVIYDYLLSEFCMVDAADLPMDQWIAAANVCDENYWFGKRYTFNGSVTSDENQRPVLEKMAQSMAGEVVDTSWDIWAGIYTAPVMDLVQTDIVGNVQVNPGISGSDVYNGVRGRFVGEETRYVATDFKPYQNPTYLAADGEELWTSIDLPYTNTTQRAHNLCRIFTEDQRNGQSYKVGFSLKAWKLKVGQRVRLTSPYWGLSSKVFRVTDKKFGPSAPVELWLKEDDPSIWDFADAVVVDATPNTTLPNPFAIPKLPTLTCTSGTTDLLIAQDGTIISRIRAVWPQTTAPNVLATGKIEIESQKIGSGVWQKNEVRGDAAEAFLSPVQDGAIYILRARPFDPEINFGADWTYATNHKVLGKSERPPNMENLSISGGVLNWAEVSRAVVRDYGGAVFRFHHGDNKDWGSAVDLHKGLITQSPYDLLTRPSGVVTIMGKHRDTSGNESTQAAVIVANVGDAVIANVVETVDFKAASFPGTLSGCSIVTGNLIAGDLDSAYGTDDQSFYGADNDPAYDISSYAQMVYTTGEVPINSALAGSVMTIEHATQGIDLFIEYRFSGPGSVYGVDSDSAYGADSDSFYGEAGVWIPWPGQIIAANDVYQFRMKLGAGPSQGQITTLRLIVDAPDIVEYLEDVPISASGTAIPYTSTFSAIKTITATLQANASGAETIEIDKTNNLAPVAKAYNSSHIAVSGATADFIIKGR